MRNEKRTLCFEIGLGELSWKKALPYKGPDLMLEGKGGFNASVLEKELSEQVAGCSKKENLPLSLDGWGVLKEGSTKVFQETL